MYAQYRKSLEAALEVAAKQAERILSDLNIASA
jgi:hypothetical protein